MNITKFQYIFLVKNHKKTFTFYHLRAILNNTADSVFVRVLFVQVAQKPPFKFGQKAHTLFAHRCEKMPKKA